MTQPVGKPPTPAVGKFNFTDAKFRAAARAILASPDFNDLATIASQLDDAQGRLRSADATLLGGVLADSVVPLLKNLISSLGVQINDIHAAVEDLEEGVDEALEGADGGGNLGGEDAEVVHDAISSSLALCETVIAAYGAQLPDEQKAMIQAVADKCKKALPIIDDIMADDGEDGEEGEEDDE